MILPDLTEAQRAQLDAALAALRASARDAFRRDVAAMLKPAPSDADVTAAIEARLGIVPVLRDV